MSQPIGYLFYHPICLVALAVNLIHTHRDDAQLSDMWLVVSFVATVHLILLMLNLWYANFLSESEQPKTCIMWSYSSSSVVTLILSLLLFFAEATKWPLQETQTMNLVLAVFSLGIFLHSVLSLCRIW